MSSDGRLLAYVEDDVLLVSTLEPGSRPIEVSREPWRFRNDIRWFPDNARLLTQGDSGLFILQSFGGVPQRLTNARSSNVSLSADGRFVLLVSSTANARILSLETRSLREFRIQGNDTFYTENTWSPDGRYVVVVSSDGKGRFQLQAVSVLTGNARVIVRDSALLSSPNWDPGSGSISYLRVNNNAGNQSGNQIWRIQVSPTGVATGAPRFVAFHDGSRIQMIDNGRHLAYTRTDFVMNYFVEGIGEDTTSRRLTESATMKWLSGRFSPDGRSVAFVLIDPTGNNVYLSSIDALALKQLTFLRGTTIYDVDWSPDSRRIAYCSTVEVARRLTVVAIDGSQPRTLPTGDLSTTCQFAWSEPDVILYHLSNRRNFAVHSLSGGPEKRLISADSVGFMFAPVADAGRNRVAVDWNRLRDGGTWLIGLGDSVQRRVAPRSRPLRFSPDGSSLYAQVNGRLIRHRLSEPGKTDTLRTRSQCEVLDVSPDGTKVLCRITESIVRDVWLMRNFDMSRPITP